MEQEASYSQVPNGAYTLIGFGLAFWNRVVPYSLIKISGNFVQVAFIE